MINFHERLLPTSAGVELVSSRTAHPTEPPRPAGLAVNQWNFTVYCLFSASLRILNRNSLVNLAKQMTGDEGHLLGVCMGMKPEKVGQIYRMYRHSYSLATFYVLYEWRGRRAQPELADRLIEGLYNIDRPDLANIVAEVRKKNRAILPSDFDSPKSTLHSTQRTTQHRRTTRR